MQIEHFAARRRILEKANSAGVHQQPAQRGLEAFHSTATPWRV